MLVSRKPLERKKSDEFSAPVLRVWVGYSRINGDLRPPILRVTVVVDLKRK